MAAPTVKIDGSPGVFKRGSRYLATWYDHDGKLRKQSFRTLKEAKAHKRAMDSARDRGEIVLSSKLTFAAYLDEWIATYNGKRGDVRAVTKSDYVRDLRRYALPFFGLRQLRSIDVADVEVFAAWLGDYTAQLDRHERENEERERVGKTPLKKPPPLRDRTVARIVSCLSAVFTTAIRHKKCVANPCALAVLPKRDKMPEAIDDEKVVKAFTREQLACVLDRVQDDWKPFFRFLAATGLRVSEALALTVDHFVLDGSRPHVKVRRAFTARGGMDRPKSKHGHREVPLSHSLVSELRRHFNGLPEPDNRVVEKWGRLAFPSSKGTPMSQGNLRRRYLKAAVEEADASWAGFHAFRHTFASIKLDDGANIVQLSRALGHHSASFTLDVYGHLLDDGMGDALDLDVALRMAERPTRHLQHGTWKAPIANVAT